MLGHRGGEVLALISLLSYCRRWWSSALRSSYVPPYAGWDVDEERCDQLQEVRNICPTPQGVLSCHPTKDFLPHPLPPP